MRYGSYDDAAKVAASGKKVFRIDVVLFNFVTEDDGTKYIDGNYYEKDGSGHPYECFFDDYWEAFQYILDFTEDMAHEALSDNTNGLGFSNVAVEVNELDANMDPGYVTAYVEWVQGTERHVWFRLGSDDTLEMVG